MSGFSSTLHQKCKQRSLCLGYYQSLETRTRLRDSLFDADTLPELCDAGLPKSTTTFFVSSAGPPKKDQEAQYVLSGLPKLQQWLPCSFPSLRALRLSKNKRPINAYKGLESRNLRLYAAARRTLQRHHFSVSFRNSHRIPPRGMVLYHRTCSSSTSASSLGLIHGVLHLSGSTHNTPLAS